MSSEAHRNAVKKYQSKKDRINLWVSPESKQALSEFAKNTPEKSMQRYILNLIKRDSGIDCDPKE